MSPTFTPAKFDDSTPYMLAKFPWPEPEPSADEVRRHSWGMVYKENKSFATPLGGKEIGKVTAEQYKKFLEQSYGVTGVQEAHQVIDHLLAGGQHVENDFLLPLAYAVKDVPERELAAEIEEKVEFLKDFFAGMGVDTRGVEHKFRHLVRKALSRQQLRHSPRLLVHGTLSEFTTSVDQQRSWDGSRQKSFCRFQIRPWRRYSTTSSRGPTSPRASGGEE